MGVREKIRRLPQKPGVYLFKDSKGKIIYIGKAIKLRNRVSSYFSGKPSDPKTARLVARIDDVEFVMVDNEIEALVLEANLVRQHKPHYNVNLKDDKRFPYIHVTDEPFPRIEVERRKSKSGMFFGPFTDGRGMRRSISLIQRHFRIRCCKHDLPEHAPSRPCLNYDIGRCDAPCQGKISKDEYLARVDEAVMFLRGKHKELVARLHDRMKKLSAQNRFEDAAEIRDQIHAIDSIWQKQKIDTDLADRDLHAIAAGPRNAVAVAMQVRQGRVIARQEFHMKISADTQKPEIMSGYLKQYYADNPDPPREILISTEPEDKIGITDFVSNIRGHKVAMRIPLRGDKKGLLDLVERNAQLLLADLVADKKKVDLPFSVLDLQKQLRLSKPPRRIEAVDISHLGGTLAVASLVTFTDGKKYSRGYRRFRIMSAEGGDDYASIYEVIHRRFMYLKEDDKGFPDLLLIDGGKGQLNAARKALDELGVVDDVELASLAKRLEEVFRPNLDKSIMLPKDSAALRLLMRVRDEAHRFAIQYQRKRRTKAFRAQELASVGGVGEIRQKRLLTEFASLEEIASATPELVSKKAKIPIEIARKVIDFLSPYKIAIFVAFFGLSILTGCTPAPRYIGGARPQITARKTTKKDKTSKPKAAPKKVETDDKTYASALPAPAKNIPTKPTSFSSAALLGAVNLYLGTPYKYGGNGLGGIDCSGFSKNVLDAAGIDIPRTSADQYRRGKPTSKPSFGDLVFFRMKGGGVDHVGVYLGANRFAHASSSSGVTIDSLNDDYYRSRFLGARRFY